MSHKFNLGEGKMSVCVYIYIYTHIEYTRVYVYTYYIYSKHFINWKISPLLIFVSSLLFLGWKKNREALYVTFDIWLRVVDPATKIHNMNSYLTENISSFSYVKCYIFSKIN